MYICSVQWTKIKKKVSLLNSDWLLLVLSKKGKFLKQKIILFEKVFRGGRDNTPDKYVTNVVYNLQDNYYR